MATENHEFNLSFTQSGAEVIGRSLSQTDKALVDLEKRAKKVAGHLGQANKKTEVSERKLLAVVETNAKRRAKVVEDSATRMRRLNELRDKRELRSAKQRGEDLEALQELQAQRRAQIEERVEIARARARERESRAAERQAQQAIQVELRNAELRARAIADAHERELALLDVKHRRETAAAKRHGADLNALVEAQSRERAELAGKLEGEVAGAVEETAVEVRDLYERLGEMGQGMEDALGPMDDMHGAFGKVLGILGGFEDVGKVLSGAAFLELAQGLLDAIEVVKAAWDEWSGQTEALENDARRREAMLTRLEEAADDYRRALENVASAEEGAFGLQGVLNLEQRGKLLDIEKRIRESEKALAQTLADIDAGEARGVGADVFKAHAKATGRTAAGAVDEARRVADGLDKEARQALRSGRIALADQLKKRAASMRTGADRQAEAAEDPAARLSRLDTQREKLSFQIGGLQLERDKLIADAKAQAKRDGIIADDTAATAGSAPAGNGGQGLTAAGALGAGLGAVLDPRTVISDALAALDEPARAAFAQMQANAMARLQQARAEIAAEMARFHAAQAANRDREIELIDDPNDREETAALLELQRRKDAELAIAYERGDDLVLLEEVFEKRRLGIVQKYAKARTTALIAERNAQASAVTTTLAAASGAAKAFGASKALQATVDRALEIANAGKAVAAGVGAATIGDVAGTIGFAAQAKAHWDAATAYSKVPGARGGGGGRAATVPVAARATSATPTRGDLGGGGGSGGRQFSGTVIINNPLIDRRAVRETVGEALSEVGDGQVVIDGEAA